MNKKGFVFVETIITTVILIGMLILVYSTFSHVITTEKNRLYYDDVAYVYKTLALKELYKEYVDQNKVGNIYTVGNFYLYLFADQSNIFTDNTAFVKAKDIYKYNYFAYIKLEDLQNLKNCINGNDSSEKCSNTKNHLDAYVPEFTNYLKTVDAVLESKHSKENGGPESVLFGIYIQNKDGSSQNNVSYNECLLEKSYDYYNALGDSCISNKQDCLKKYYKNDSVSFSMACSETTYFTWVYL